MEMYSDYEPGANRTRRIGENGWIYINGKKKVVREDKKRESSCVTDCQMFDLRSPEVTVTMWLS